MTEEYEMGVVVRCCEVFGRCCYGDEKFDRTTIPEPASKRRTAFAFT
jgi:hypothetical protein